MKSIIQFSLCFALLFGFLFGQNYRLFNPAREYSYATWPAGPSITVLDHHIRIDSMSVNGSDTSWFGYKMAEPTLDTFGVGNPCFYTINDTHWLGERVIEKPNGDYLLITRKADTLLIQSQAAAGSNWIFQNLGGGDFIKAEIVAPYTQNIFGNIDSIKTILLTAINQLGVLIPHPFNNKYIKLSKNYGLTLAYEFLYFPDSTQALQLAGVRQPDLGRTDLGYLDVFNYDIGDEVHSKREELRFAPGVTYYFEETWTICRVISKTVLTNPDTILYDIARWRTHTRTDTSGIVTTHTTDTISSMPTHGPDYMLNYLPYETRIPVQLFQSAIIKAPSGDFPLFYTSDYYGRTQKVYYTSVTSSPCGIYDNCNYLGPIPFKYIKGVGGAFYEYGDGLMGGNNKLIYYSKGIETWGTPLSPAIFTNLESKISQPFIRVFPNPAQNYFEILHSDLPLGTVFRVFDAQGIELYSTDTNTGNILHVETNAWPSGIYFYKFERKEGHAITGKIMKL